jgi:GT2 family glycosyltransferase
MSEKVFVVVVAYRRPESLLRVLASLRAQTRPPDMALVVDNSGDESVFSALRPLPPGVTYIRMPGNTGSAGGYHRGMEQSLSQGADFIWTLDDDVVCAPEALENLLAGFASMPDNAVAALRCVGPEHVHKTATPLVVFSWRGTLFRAAAVREAGLPDERYFLYGDDLEYSLRLSSLGKKFFWCPGARCDENSDDGKLVVAFMGRTHRLYASPLRSYYAFRNEIAIYLKYRQYGALCGVLWYACKLSAFMLVTLRFTQCLFICYGIWDGFFCKLGRRTQFLYVRS